jgi:hypothetical protein
MTRLAGIRDAMFSSAARVVRAVRTWWTPVRRHPRRLELAWTESDRAAVEGRALAAAPREGGIVAFCHRSTGTTRETVIVGTPLIPIPGDLGYARGAVVTITSQYWNRVIDALRDQPEGTGVVVLHTHPGADTPEWSSDDQKADRSLASFLFGEGFVPAHAPLVSLVASHTDLRGRMLTYDATSGSVTMTPIQRVRTISLSQISLVSTADRAEVGPESAVPAAADRSVRVFGKAGQRQLADLHVALVGTGGVGSICGEHLARWGVGTVSTWDPDHIEDVNINRSGVYTWADARKRLLKARTLAEALETFSLVRTIRTFWSASDIRQARELPRLLDADIIVSLVDDARPRHFLNQLAGAHYIPVIDAGNVVRSTAEDDAEAETAEIEGAAVRISVIVPGGPCLWCAGHITPYRLGLAYRSDADKAADRARGYVEHLGPEHAPSVMPINAATAALLELRLMDLMFRLSRRPVAEVYLDVLNGSLDELPRSRRANCRQCGPSTGLGDLAKLPHIE